MITQSVGAQPAAKKNKKKKSLNEAANCFGNRSLYSSTTLPYDFSFFSFLRLVGSLERRATTQFYVDSLLLSFFLFNDLNEFEVG